MGQLSARTGMPAKVIRELEGRGLIYTAGRSPANYRLFDESALWCVEMIMGLRALGLTLREIEELAGVFTKGHEQTAGRHLSTLLERVENRIDERMSRLQDARRRVRSFKKQYASGIPLDIAPGVKV